MSYCKGADEFGGSKITCLRPLKQLGVCHSFSHVKGKHDVFDHGLCVAFPRRSPADRQELQSVVCHETDNNFSSAATIIVGECRQPGKPSCKS